MPKTKQVPGNALIFRASVLGVEADAADVDAGTVSLLARSSQPIDHWYWGKVVHDLSGVIVKERIPLDYSHDTGEIIGYLDSFEVTDEGLRAGGKLVSFTETDRAAEVAYKAGEGIPYEASINFAGDGIEVEEIDEGATADVNGYTLSGPAAVIRAWNLRGVAVTPYGADSATESEIFTSTGDVPVQFINRNEVNEMSDETAAVAVDDVEALQEDAENDDQVEEETDEEQTAEEAVSDAVAGAHDALDNIEEVVGDALADDEGDDDADDEGDEDADDEGDEEVEASETSAATSLNQADGKLFVEKFGERGALWFVDGKSYDECVELFVAGMTEELDILRVENAELRQRVDAVDRGEDDALGFSAAPSSADNERRAKFNEYQKQLGSPSAAAFAARFETNDN